MSEQALEIKRSSAAMWGTKTGLRTKETVSKYIDTTTCIGCKACEAACVEWNDLRPFATHQEGSYQTLPQLDAEFWNLIRFNERTSDDGGPMWLMRKDQCMHCAEPGCLAACPAPGAIVQYANGIVDVDATKCIGCGYCPTGCLQFGTKEEMVQLGNARVAQLKRNGFEEAMLYDPPGVNGTSVVTIL